jgi:non-ribosomal peptide synthase protein (TIGR01720 family)
VGWFTSLFPVALDTGKARGPGQVLKTVKEQLRRIPDKGIGYGILRYLAADEQVRAALRAVPAAQVSFNYLGQADNGVRSELFQLAPESAGSVHGDQGRRSHLLEVNAVVSGGRLAVTWTYSENLHRRATISAVAGWFLEELRELVRHCLSPDAGGYTPSDFPLARLDQDAIDRLFADSGQLR